ncbi:MAG: molecular chaperone HtpG [Lachnospiraceae bacterium]|nr:molecular chaperone HtpG [Lachnospiraceae bacterium]
MATKGSLSINSDNIFPIIKKWLYSDHDIFVRELISNGCDAITKLKKLDMMGEYSIPDDNKFAIKVIASAKNKTLTFIDNGLGMTADEVEEYINQIAFSGATDFLEKYKDKANEDQIIGHFGLGFYSAFMVADEVEINTLSYKEGAKAVHWICDGGTEYEMEDGDKTTVGTEIILHLNEDCLEFANEYRLQEVIEKYCSFMPTEIFLENADEQKTENVEESELLDTDEVIEKYTEPAKTQEIEKEDGTKETTEIAPEKKMAKIVKRPVALNDTHPLWAKHPNECSEEEYKEFYHKVFRDYKEPLFWIHLNMDYPFNLKGILYFPKVNLEMEDLRGTIKLYNNQVFIADNIEEVIPEFLMLLKGVIDCPDLPLNVSRSALQNDGFVKKINDYITKKVADKLSGMCKTDKDNYIKYWDDISPFIKFGCLKDEKFCEKMSEHILFKNIDDKYLTLKECLEENKEKHENTVFYVTDKIAQSQYIAMFKKEGIDAVMLTQNIDSAFITQLEQKNEGVKFLRIDSDLTDNFKEEVKEEDKESLDKDREKLENLFKKVLGRDNIKVKLEKLKDENISSMVTQSEDTRRMQDMMKMYSFGDNFDPNMFGGSEDLVLNANNNLVKFLLEKYDGEAENVDETTSLITKQLYDLALLSHGPLSPESMSAFVERTNKMMTLLAK